MPSEWLAHPPRPITTRHRRRLTASLMPVGDDPSVAICVPVRNEAVRLPRLLAAIEALQPVYGRAPHLCLLLDGCTDDSEALARHHRAVARGPVHIAYAPDGPPDSGPEAGPDAGPNAGPNAGKARHRAMQMGIAALGPRGGLLLTTDADSCPRIDWLAAMVFALGQADVVAGQVVRPRADGDQSRLHAYYERLFALRRRLDPVPWEAAATHHHASGANMGLSSAVYTDLGGFLPIPQGEDARLVDDAARAGLRVRRDAASVVVTSDRRDGRAAGGLADLLRRIDRDGLGEISVAHPGDAAWQYHMQAVARAAFPTLEFERLAGLIDLSPDHLLGVARDCPNAEAFAMRVVPTPPGGMRRLPFAAAVRTLDAMIAEPVADLVAACAA